MASIAGKNAEQDEFCACHHAKQLRLKDFFFVPREPSRANTGPAFTSTSKYPTAPTQECLQVLHGPRQGLQYITIQ